MGYYVNPKSLAKEEFLAKHGKLLPLPTWPPLPDQALICLVDNGIFNAAAVLVDEREFNAFAKPSASDDRPRSFWLVDKDLVIANSDAKHSDFKY